MGAKRGLYLKLKLNYAKYNSEVMILKLQVEV